MRFTTQPSLVFEERICVIDSNIAMNKDIAVDATVTYQHIEPDLSDICRENFEDELLSFARRGGNIFPYKCVCRPS
jgi:hypothetical protein